MTVEDIEQATSPVVDTTAPADFLVGYWASIGEYSFGMAQPGMTVWFDGEHGCFYSPYDTYRLEQEDDHYILYCTNYLWGDTLDFRVDIIDADNIAINFRRSSESTYLTRTDEEGNFLGTPYSGDTSGNVFEGIYPGKDNYSEAGSTDQEGSEPQEDIKSELRMLDIHGFSGSLDQLPEALTQGRASTDYNSKLAYLMIALCNDVYSKSTILQDYEDMGFDASTQQGYRALSGISYSLGKKYLDDGTEEILVVIKGTENTAEIMNDLNKGLGAFSSPHWHGGFEGTSKTVYDDVLKYADDIKNAKIYITGFSLGAATANLLSVRLSDYGVPRDNIYDYNFACPDVAVGFVTEWDKDGVHDNMFNLGHCRDVVTVVPGAACNVTDVNIVNQWGKFGRSLWYSNDWGNAEETKLDLAVWNFTYHNQWKYLDFFNRNQDNGADIFKDYAAWRAQNAGNKVGAFFSWVGSIFKCPVDVIIRDKDGVTIAAVIDGEIDYCGSEPGQVLIFTNGDEKAFLVPEQDIQIRLAGTGSGTMDMYTWRGMPDDERSVSSYTGVELYDGKNMICMVDDSGKEITTQLAVLDENDQIADVIKPDKKTGSKKWIRIVIIVVVVIVVAVVLFFVIDSIMASDRNKRRRKGSGAGTVQNSRSRNRRRPSRNRRRRK